MITLFPDQSLKKNQLGWSKGDLLSMISEGGIGTQADKFSLVFWQKTLIFPAEHQPLLSIIWNLSCSSFRIFSARTMFRERIIIRALSLLIDFPFYVTAAIAMF